MTYFIVIYNYWGSAPPLPVSSHDPLTWVPRTSPSRSRYELSMYWGSRRPLHEPSSRSLPFSPAERAEGEYYTFNSFLIFYYSLSSIHCFLRAHVVPSSSFFIAMVNYLGIIKKRNEEEDCFYPLLFRHTTRSILLMRL
jgi:hypothetical protein